MRLTRGLLAIAIVAAVSVGSLGFAMSLVESKLPTIQARESNVYQPIVRPMPADVDVDADPALFPNPCGSQVECMWACASARPTGCWQSVWQLAWFDGVRCHCTYVNYCSDDSSTPQAYQNTVTCKRER